MTDRLLSTLISGRFAISGTVLLTLLLALIQFCTLPADNNLLFGLLDGRFSILINWGIITLTALLIVMLNNQYQIIRERTKLTFFLPLFFSTCTILYTIPYTYTLAGLCILAAFFPLFLSYQKENATEEIFNSAILFSIASLLNIHLLLCIPLFYWSFYQFRSLTWRTFFASIIGFMAPYWMVIGYFLVSGKSELISFPTTSFLTNFRHPTDFTWHAATLLILTLFSSFIAIAQILRNTYHCKIQARIFLQINIWFQVTCLVLTYLYPIESLLYIYLFYLSATLLLAHLFTLVRNKFASLLFYLLTAIYLLYFIINL